MNLAIVRAAGIAGVLGAVFWAIGDVLLVGGSAAPADYPLLFKDYADRIPFGALDRMVALPEARLAAGALIPNIAIPLYLIGSWHLFEGIRPAGRWVPLLVFALLFCGNAWSPLGHAAFFYPGMVYKTILAVPPDAYDALLTLGAWFEWMLRIAWLLPVVTLALALLLFAIAIAMGRSAYPRWAAAILNPVTPLLVAEVGEAILPAPLAQWSGAAVLNVGFFIIYTLSTVLLWNGGRTTPQTAGQSGSVTIN